MRCQFTAKKIVDGKEIIYECQEGASAIIRTLDVCQHHFRKLKQDNIHRVWYENGVLNDNPDEEDDIEYIGQFDELNDTFIPSSCDLEIKDKRIFGGMKPKDYPKSL